MSKVEFLTAKGTEVTVELVRNQKLSLNGKWMDSAEHTMVVKAGGSSYSFDRAEQDPEHGYSLKIGPMGKATLPVPADYQDAVQALVAEHKEHNAQARADRDAAEAAYQDHHNKIESAR